jgi:hypothetical protein
MTLFMRHTIFAFVLGAALAAAFFSGRAAHATDTTIEACFKPSNGTLYLLGGGSGRTECQSGDIPISWNTAGVNGQDGVSVTSEALDPGEDPACANGGSKFTSISGDTYACNGTNGTNGTNGEDGEDFDGSFTSPNGLYSLNVDNAGARIEGPTGTGRILLDSSGIRLLGPLGSLKLQTGVNSLDSLGNLTVDAAGTLTAHGTLLALNGGALTSVTGALINLNGSGCGVLRPPDIVSFVGLDGGPILLVPGSPTVRTGC